MNVKRSIAIFAFAGFVLCSLTLNPVDAASIPNGWQSDWPKTDFSKTSVDLSEIFSGGPSKDGIPAIDNPAFLPASQITDLGPLEPVIALHVNGEFRAYPLRILMWHEIVNDRIGGVPVTVTYCPLCNSSIVFDRRLDGMVLDFGTTGNLRNSDLVMYDRQTESWWQQFLGQGIVGSMTGKILKILPSRLESFERFKKRAPDGKVLVPSSPNMRNYGANPYVGYDSRDTPYGFFRGEMPAGIDAMVRVVVVDGEAWSLPLLKSSGVLSAGDGLQISWQAGQNSALDSRQISRGRDVGNIVVRQRQGDGWLDVAHDITFAFVFNAFHPNGVIHQ
jgi:hypothetical protein